MPFEPNQGNSTIIACLSWSDKEGDIPVEFSIRRDHLLSYVQGGYGACWG
jgi:hypothetical protein